MGQWARLGIVAAIAAALDGACAFSTPAISLRGSIFGQRQSTSPAIAAPKLRPSATGLVAMAAGGGPSADKDSNIRAMNLLQEVISGLPVTGGYSSSGQLFEKYDLDKDGRIDETELRNAFRGMGALLSQEQFDDLLGLMDVDRSGFIDMSEFVSAMELAEARAMQQTELDQYELTLDDDAWMYEDATVSVPESVEEA